MDVNTHVVPRVLPLPLVLKVARVLLFTFGIFGMLSFLSQLSGWVFAREAIVEQAAASADVSAGFAQTYLIVSLLWMLVYAIGQLVIGARIREGGPGLVVATCALMGVALVIQITQMLAFGVPGGTESASEIIFGATVWLTCTATVLTAVLVLTPLARAYFRHNASDKPTW